MSKLLIRIQHRLLLFLFTVAVVIASPVTAYGQSHAENMAQLRSAWANIEQADEAINEAAKLVLDAISAIRDADHFEGPHWKTLDQSVQDWADVMQKSAEIIDQNAQTILRIDPSATINLSQHLYFGIEMRGLRDQLRNIQVDFERAIERAEQTRQRQAQIRSNVKGEMRDGMVNLAINTTADVLGIPTSAGDVAGSVILKGAEVAGHWIAKPIGLAQTGVKFVVGFYYLADEAQSGARSLKSADEVDAFAQEFISRSRANIRSAQQGIDWVEKLWSQGTRTRENFNRTQSGWRIAAAEYSRQQAAQAVSQLEQEFEKPTPKVKIVSNWCSAKVPDLEASEFKPEAEGILRDLRSAAMAAAFDGGSPLTYHEIKEGHMQRLHERYKEILDKRQKTFEARNQAITRYLNELNAAGSRWWQCHNSCSSNDCRDRCDARKDNEKAQACAALSPYSTAHTQAAREATRQSRILGFVHQESHQLDHLIKKESDAANNRYALLLAEHSAAYGAVLSQINLLIRQLPNMYQLNAYQDAPDWANRAVDSWMRGGNIHQIRDMIATQAKQIRESGQLAKTTLAQYNRLQSELQMIGIRAKFELDTMQQQLGPLLYYDYTIGIIEDDPFLPYGIPRPSYNADSIQQRIMSAKQRHERSFTFEEPQNVEVAARFPFESTARAVESRLGELDDLISRLDTFNFRLSNLNHELDRASRALTNQPLYSGRQNNVPAQILEDFTSGSWSGFSQSVNALFEQHWAMIQSTYQQLNMPIIIQPAATPRQKLMTFQHGLLNHTNHVMANYIRVSQQGEFLPVDPAEYENIRAAWNNLKALHPQHESLAAPERNRLEAARMLLPDETNLNRAYQALPPVGKSAVASRLNRYRSESSWLTQYASRKASELQTLDTDATGFAHLQAIIEEYPDAKIAWERRQTEQRQAEEQRRRQEELRAQQAAQEREAQLQRQQELAMARQASSREALLKEVPEFYREFVDAYGRGDLRGLLRLLAPDWQGGDGADLRDVEEYLTNSFRVFDRIQYRMSGLTATPLADGRVRVSYSVRIVGENRRQRLTHEEQSDVVEELGMVDGRVRIVRTLSGTQWLR